LPILALIHNFFTMANNHFLASIYAFQPPLGSYTYLSGTQGHLNSFPSVGTRFYPTAPGTTASSNNVVMNSVIELAPTGLNVTGMKFYTPATVTDLNTAAT
jgi:hypothetical protein